MKAILLAATVLCAAAPNGAAHNTARVDWDDPFELKDIRSGFGWMRVAAAGKNAAGDESTAAARRLMDLKRPQLEGLYRGFGPGPIPDGKADGLATLSAGTDAGRASEVLLSVFWRGKVFDRKNGELVNRLAAGRAVKAKVFLGPSWLDGKPSVIIDYRGESWIAGAVRDEIREVAPGVYLGFAYVRDADGGDPRADILFALDFTSSQPEKPKAP